MRISEADRQRVVEELGHHLTAGRLDVDAYADRVGEVMGAQTLADLDHARRDLPFMRVVPPGERSLGSGGLPGGVLAAGAAARRSGGVWTARMILLLAALLVVIGAVVAITAQVAYVAVLGAGWIIGIATGRASSARR